MNRFHQQALLLDSLRDPARVLTLDCRGLEWLLRMARRARLVASLGHRLDRAGLMKALPEQLQAHFQAGRTYAAYRSRLIRWELNRLQRALRDTDYPVIALKGGAYLISGLPFAETRLAADVDILVPCSVISNVEARLQDQGWATEALSEYDEKYYRQWMHEIPPMRHRERHVEVDAHHALLPLTAKLNADPELLFKDAVQLEGQRFRVLCPEDMILHAAVHLFYDSDLDNRLRDLVDIDELLRHFCGARLEAWQALVVRAKQHNLQRPLYHALRYSRKLLHTPVPQGLNGLEPAPPWVRLGMDRMVPRAILPDPPDHSSSINACCRWLLYLRSHYLRMPLRLLVPHLLYKGARRQVEKW